MKAAVTFVIPVSLLGVFIFWITGSTGADDAIPNLTESCYKCLCYVSTKCDLTNDCAGGYCGPFNISRVYWIDAGSMTLSGDDPDRNHAYQDCTRDYDCSKRTIEGYLRKFGQDCNGDGETNCFDYMMVNGNGGYGCTWPLNRSESGRKWLKRFTECILD